MIHRDTPLKSNAATADADADAGGDDGSATRLNVFPSSLQIGGKREDDAVPSAQVKDIPPGHPNKNSDQVALGIWAMGSEVHQEL